MLTILISTLVCLAVVAIPLSILVVLYVRELQFRRRAQKTTGTVTALMPGSSYSSSGHYSTTVYYPVVAFQAVDGRSGSITGSVGSSRPAYKVGQQVELYYDPANPAEAHMGSLLGGSPWLLVLGILTLVFGLVGGVFWVIIVVNTLKGL